MSSYENSRWETGPDGVAVLVRIPTWYITDLLTRHSPDCRVCEELRRSVGKGLDAERRLSLAETTACTCGARDESEVEWWVPTVVDKRDNRDPAKVGSEHIGRARWNGA